MQVWWCRLWRYTNLCSEKLHNLLTVAYIFLQCLLPPYLHEPWKITIYCSNYYFSHYLCKVFQHFWYHIIKYVRIRIVKSLYFEHWIEIYGKKAQGRERVVVHCVLSVECYTCYSEIVILWRSLNSIHIWIELLWVWSKVCGNYNQEELKDIFQAHIIFIMIFKSFFKSIYQ